MLRHIFARLLPGRTPMPSASRNSREVDDSEVATNEAVVPVTDRDVREAVASARELERSGAFASAWTRLHDEILGSMRTPRSLAATLQFARRHGHLAAGIEVAQSLTDEELSDPRTFRAAVNMFKNMHDHAEARALADRKLTLDADDPEAVAVLVNANAATGQHAEAEAILTALNGALREEPRVQVAEAELRYAMHDWDRASASANAALAGLETPPEEIEKNRVNPWVTRATSILDAIGVRTRAAELLREASVCSSECKGVVAVFSNGSPFVTLTATLPVRELIETGYQVVHLSTSDETLDAGRQRDDCLASFTGCLGLGAQTLRDSPIEPNALVHDWAIDWRARKVEWDGINFYQVIFESLCNRFRRFTIDIDDVRFQAAFTYYLRAADRTLAVTLRLFEEVAGQGVPLRILSGASHLVPAGVFRQFCESRGYERDMHFIITKPSYEHYFTNMTNKRITRVVFEDLTRYRAVQRLPVFARIDQFDAWLKDAPTLDDSRARVSKIIKFDRTRKMTDAPGAAQAMESILAAQRTGRPVVCIMGKILYDICEPTQGGPAHADIHEWLNDSLVSAAASNALFLVKPHPSETKRSFGTPTERFTDLIECEIPDNVIVLEHRWFNIGDLLDVIDLGVVWAGMTALELGAAGLPCIVCNTWGTRDHPVDFPCPSDRDDYWRMLADPKSITWTDAQRDRCIQIIDCLSSVTFQVPYPFMQVPMRGLDKAPKVWREDELTRYLRDGDPHVSLLASRISGT